MGSYMDRRERKSAEDFMALCTRTKIESLVFHSMTLEREIKYDLLLTRLSEETLRTERGGNTLS